MQPFTWYETREDTMKELSETKAQATLCSKPAKRRERMSSTTKDPIAMLSKHVQPLRRLTQEELNAWWPFDRLDPKLFPKNLKTTFSHTEEDALL